jgi:hypothetical protein
MCVALGCTLAAIPTPLRAEPGAGGAFTHPTGAYSLPIPAGWKAFPFASAPGIDGTVVAPNVSPSPKAVATGLWVHLVPIPTDEQLDDGLARRIRDDAAAHRAS